VKFLLEIKSQYRIGCYTIQIIAFQNNILRVSRLNYKMRKTDRVFVKVRRMLFVKRMKCPRLRKHYRIKAARTYYLLHATLLQTLLHYCTQHYYKHYYIIARKIITNIITNKHRNINANEL